MSEVSPWARKVERGTVLALRFVRFMYLTLGRRVTTAILWPVAAYFFLFDGGTRRASRDWLAAVWATPAGRATLRHEPGPLASLRHVHNFAVNIFDRMVLWAGEEDAFQLDHVNSDMLFALARQGRGALLVGAHVGSFDMLRLISRQQGLRVNVLMFTANAERVNDFFASLGEGSRVRVIPVDPASVQAAFEIKACLDRGEFVGILADRVHPGGRERPVEVQFLGRRAAFPLTPFLLGAVLGAPMFLALGLGRGDAHYLTLVEPIHPGGRLPRGERDKVAREVQTAWVRRLEEYCLRQPYQWFNFYDFFADGVAALESRKR